MIDLVKHNFQEAYHAASQKLPTSLSLVPNLSGTRLYDSSKGWGKLWSCFFGIGEGLTGKNLQSPRRRNAVLLCHQTFLKQLAQLSPHLKDYQDYLDKMGKEYAVKESDLFVARNTITQWNQATRPFIQLLKRTSNPSLVQLFQNCFGKHLTKEELSHLFIPPAENCLRRYQFIIDLEGLNGGPLPLVAFKKIIKGKPLNLVDNKALEKWIKRMNPMGAHSGGLIHKALKAITGHYLKKIEDWDCCQSDVARLELALEDKGCTVLQQPDPKHISWRQQLKPGSRVRFNSKHLILGSEFPSDNLMRDQSCVFNVEGEAARVAVVAQNCAVLPIKQLRNSLHGDLGILPVQILEIASNGKIALVERLKPLNSMIWQSRNGIVCNDDQPILKTLVALMQWLIRNDFTPSNFSSAFLMFDNQYRLKTLKPMQKLPFDFNALEDFAFHCADGNLTIFQHLMQKSNLTSHPTAIFYHEIVLNALNEVTFDLNDLAGIYKIGDSRVIERGKELIHTFLAMRQNLLNQFKSNHSQQELKEDKAAFSSSILANHRKSQAAGRIWPTLIDDVIASQYGLFD